MTKNTDTAVENQQGMEDLAGKYLTFELGDESYGLQILKVQEIIKMQEITKVPRTPDYVKGVINLRGKVMPVIDLRTTFGMEEVEASRNTCIIVVQVQRGETSVILGVIVDKVSEVLEIGAEEIEPAPSFGTQVDTHFILGMAKTKDSVKILLDIDKIMSEGEMESLAQTGS
jgi:purine-binding chemotaxis protein CheW